MNRHLVTPVLFVHQLPASVRAAGQAGLAVTLFVVGAALESKIQLIWSDKSADVRQALAWLSALTATGLLYGLACFVYSRVIAYQVEVEARQQRTIQSARERVVGLHREQLGRCDELTTRAGTPTTEAFRSVLICDRDRLNQLVRIIWDIVNSHHNVSTIETQRVNFEVTLITKSRTDRNYTIAAWWNREMIKPKSLVDREVEPGIHDKTDAAKLMRLGTVDTVVIEDTSDPELNYEQLYAGQKVRIQSSVLHPIASPSRKPLCVIVLHCERKGFFKKSDQRYWHELFSIFAPALALELERIDAYNSVIAGWSENPKFSAYAPF